MSATITLVASDGTAFSAPASMAKFSTTLSDMLEDMPADAMTQPIPLPNVDAPTLKWIIAWCQQAPLPPPPTPPAPSATTPTPDTTGNGNPTPESDALCAGLSQADLFSVILAANYLSIRPLLDASCKIVADAIKGKSVEEIRAAFNIINDFTPEEEDTIRRENEWCEAR